MCHEFLWGWPVSESGYHLVGYVVPSTSEVRAMRSGRRYVSYTADYRSGTVEFRFRGVSAQVQYPYCAIDVLREPAPGALRVRFLPADVTFVSETGASVREVVPDCAYDAPMLMAAALHHVISLGYNVANVTGRPWLVGYKAIAFCGDGRAVTPVMGETIAPRRSELGLRVVAQPTFQPVAIDLRAGTYWYTRNVFRVVAGAHLAALPQCIRYGDAVVAVLFQPGDVLFADYHSVSVSEYIVPAPRVAHELGIALDGHDTFYSKLERCAR